MGFPLIFNPLQDVFLNHMDSVAEILSILEDDDKLLKYREPKTGLPLWPFVRWEVISYLVYTRKGIGLQPVTHKASFGTRLKILFFVLFKNPFLLAFQRKSVLFFCSEISSIKKEKGKHFNQYVDYFYYAASDKTALVEESAFGRRVVPRIHSQVYARIFFRLVGFVFSKFFYPDKRKLKSEVGELFIQIQKKIHSLDIKQEALDKIRETVLKNFPRIFVEYYVYRLFFKLTKPSVIVIECGCYGDSTHLIAAAKEYGVHVSEYQHGLINRDHFAYNYGSSIKNSIYLRYLPDSFLSYGPYWSASINVPIKIYNIGNPHLSEFTKEESAKRKKVLVLGAVGEAASMISLIKEVHDQYAPENYDVVFRPHPYQWAAAEVTYKELMDLGIQINAKNHLYASLQDAEIIIGELSTTLYEAKAFSPNVYMIRNSLGEIYGAELTGLFPFWYPGIGTVDDSGQNFSGHIWQPEWKNRYLEFLTEHIK